MFKIKKDSPGEAVVRERVSKSLDNDRKKFGPAWKYSHGPLFSKAKVLYWIAAVCSVFVTVASIMLVFFALSAKLGTDKAQEVTFYKTEAVVVILLLLVLILSIVLMAMKKIYTSCKVTFVFGAVLAFQIIEVLTGDYIKKSTLIIAYCVCFLIVVAALIMFLIIHGEKKAENKALQKELKKIYDHYSSEDGALIAEDQWDEYILKYEKERKEYLAKKSK